MHLMLRFSRKITAETWHPGKRAVTAGKEQSFQVLFLRFSLFLEVLLNLFMRMFTQVLFLFENSFCPVWSTKSIKKNMKLWFVLWNMNKLNSNNNPSFSFYKNVAFVFLPPAVSEQWAPPGWACRYGSLRTDFLHRLHKIHLLLFRDWFALLNPRTLTSRKHNLFFSLNNTAAAAFYWIYSDGWNNPQVVLLRSLLSFLLDSYQLID